MFFPLSREVKYSPVFSLPMKFDFICVTNNLSNITLILQFVTLHIQHLHSEINKYTLKPWMEMMNEWLEYSHYATEIYWRIFQFPSCWLEWRVVPYHMERRKIEMRGHSGTGTGSKDKQFISKWNETFGSRLNHWEENADRADSVLR